MRHPRRRGERGLGDLIERRAFLGGSRAERVQDEQLLERPLGVYQRKYPDEIAKWAPRMRGGYRDGTRQLLRHTPR